MDSNLIAIDFDVLKNFPLAGFDIIVYKSDLITLIITDACDCERYVNVLILGIAPRINIEESCKELLVLQCCDYFVLTIRRGFCQCVRERLDTCLRCSGFVSCCDGVQIFLGRGAGWVSRWRVRRLGCWDISLLLYPRRAGALFLAFFL